MADETQTGSPVWMTTHEAAEYLGRSTKTLRNWRSKGKKKKKQPIGPAYHNPMGTMIRYTLEDLDAFLATNRVTHAT